MLYVKRIHQDWKKKWGLKLCGYLFWNKTIFNNLIILVVKPGWIVHAKYGFFFFVINSKSILNDAHKFSANTAETALFNFLDCWHQHLLLLSTFSDATSLWPIPASRLSFFFFLFPAQYPLHPKGADLKSAQSDLKENITSSPDQISQSAFCVHFLDAEIQSSETWLQSLFHTLPTPQGPLES